MVDVEKIEALFREVLTYFAASAMCGSAEPDEVCVAAARMIIDLQETEELIALDDHTTAVFATLSALELLGKLD